MVRLAYKCPESGVIILGAFFSETTLMRYHDSTAFVECPSCGSTHHPKGFECKAYVSARAPIDRASYLHLVTEPA